jgi:hypothetical protein
LLQRISRPHTITKKDFNEWESAYFPKACTCATVFIEDCWILMIGSFEMFLKTPCKTHTSQVRWQQ